MIARKLWECGEDLVGLGESPVALPREQELAVGDHVELALLALDGRRFVVRPSVDLGRETRGPAVIAVSDGAVEDLDARHARRLPVAHRRQLHPLVSALDRLLLHEPDAA